MNLDISHMSDTRIAISFINDNDPILPTTPVSLSNGKEALDKGYIFAEKLFDQTRGGIKVIHVLQDNDLDIMVLDINEGMSWGSAENPSSQYKKIEGFLQNYPEALAAQTPLYLNPNKAIIPDQQRIDDFIDNEKNEEGSIFHKVSKDKGNITAQIDRASRILTIAFSGACATACVDKDVVPTRGKVATAFKAMWPGIRIEFQRI